MNVSSSIDALVLALLRDASGPLTVNEIEQRLPAEAVGSPGKLRPKLKTVLARPEVGRAGRGRYLYLPHRITGSTLRIPLVGTEVEAGRMFITADVTKALWFRQIDRGRVEIGATAVVTLPNGAESPLTVSEVLRNPSVLFGGVPFAALGPELREWLRSERPMPGDSLRVRVTEGERPVCSTSLERLQERDQEQVDARNRELADAVAQILRDEVRSSPLFAHDVAEWLLARGFYRHELPPDPLDVALLTDHRFAQTDDGKFALATKWEWTRFRQPDVSRDVMGSLLSVLLPPVTSTDPDEETVTEALRRAEYGTDPITALLPWLRALGILVEKPDAPEKAAEIEAQTVQRRQQVYRIRATLERSHAAPRILELQGDDTLVDFDELLRQVFKHDKTDHMSGFAVQTAGGRRPEWLACINPLGEIEEGEEYELAELNLEPGDELTFVYDFGDWIEHRLTVEAVLPPAPRAVYPRQVADAAPSRRGKR